MWVIHVATGPFISLLLTWALGTHKKKKKTSLLIHRNDVIFTFSVMSLVTLLLFLISPNLDLGVLVGENYTFYHFMIGVSV